jgi:hypothetical protein
MRVIAASCFRRITALPVPLRHMKAPDMDFFFQNKAALDDDDLFHHRKNCRIAFLSDGRHAIDLTANRYSIDLHPFVVQRFIRRNSPSRALRC